MIRKFLTNLLYNTIGLLIVCTVVAIVGYLILVLWHEAFPLSGRTYLVIMGVILLVMTLKDTLKKEK